jgi:hypothetical protein
MLPGLKGAVRRASKAEARHPSQSAVQTLEPRRDEASVHEKDVVSAIKEHPE